MTDYLYQAKQAHPTSEMEIALQEALKNDEFGDVRWARDAAGNTMLVGAGGEVFLQTVEVGGSATGSTVEVG